jgi:hypothetical protein
LASGVSLSAGSPPGLALTYISPRSQIEVIAFIEREPVDDIVRKWIARTRNTHQETQYALVRHDDD